MRCLAYPMLFVLLACMLVACDRATGPQQAAASSPDANPAAAGAPVLSRDRWFGPSTVRIPENTQITIRLADGVSSDRSRTGDVFEGSLAEPIVVDRQVVVDRSTQVRGRVADVVGSGRIKGRAKLDLVLTSLVIAGQEISITTAPFVGVARSTKKRDATVIGIGAGLGTAIGAIAGGGKGAAIGAAVGGGSGTGAVLATKGEELRYPPETRLTFRLERSVDVPVPR